MDSNISGFWTTGLPESPSVKLLENYANAETEEALVHTSSPEEDCYATNYCLYDLKELADFHYHRGEYSTSRSIFKTILMRVQADLQLSHLTIMSKENLPVSCVHSGNYEEAERLFREVLVEQRDVAGDSLDSFGLYKAYHNMGTVQGDLNRFTEGEAYFRTALQWRTKNLGEDHTDTLSTLNGLAIIRMKAGQYREAEDLLSRIIKGYQKLGTNHLYMIRALRTKAVVLGL